jgi:manganese/zinc/iron transport system substrate-binding protein
MFKSFIPLICLVLTILTACKGNAPSHPTVQEWMTPNGKIKVLSTTAMINDLVTAIGGDFVDAMILIKGELDPHSYQLVKGDDEKLSFAQIIFFNGLGLEHGPSLQQYLLTHPKSIGLGDRLVKEHPPLLLYFRGQPDPHIWMDVSLWAQSIPYIVAALSQADPEHASTFQSHGEKLLGSLMETHQKVRNTLQDIPAAKRYLVTSHDAFNYFTRAYLAAEGESEKEWMERFAAPEGLAPESQISTTDIQAIVTHLKQYHIHVLFPESNVNRDSIRKIVESAKQKGLDVRISETPLYADAMGKPGSDGDTYIKMMQHNASVIGDHLKNNGG